jgi:hypothetical protein
LADPAADPAGEDGQTLLRPGPVIGIRRMNGVVTVNVGRKVGDMFVERCWLCLEQPAVTTVRSADGRDYPMCDVCSVEHPHGPDTANRTISDDDLRRIVGDSA